jgi:hypothetical protein
MRFGVRLTWCILPWMMACGACQASNSMPTIGFYKLDNQRLTGETTAIVKTAGFADLTILVTIDTTGKVIAATPTDNYQKLDAGLALSLVRGWTFRPQTFDGNPVNAIGRVSVTYRERPIPVDTSIVFPEGPAADTAITLERGACFGNCPDYRVTVHGDGLVEFDTGDEHFKGAAAQVHLEYNGHNVLLPGRHTARVDPASVAQLFERFRAAHFFGLKKEYVYGATDNSTQVLTVRIGKASKTVTDYIGTQAGMPQEVRDLEDAVDLVAGTARWVSGDAQTLAELDAAHFEYQSEAGVKLIIAAASKLSDYRPPQAVETFISGLIDRGVPLDAKINNVSVGTTLVRVAASQGREALFNKLAARNVLSAMPRSAINAAFNNIGCSPKIARALVASGADPRIAGDNGTALTGLRGSAPTCEEQPDKMLEMARTLIALGVPLEARDSLGWTALMGCDSTEFAQLLLAHGADPKARDKEGTTTVLATDDDRVALILLRGGADPRARKRKESVRSTATKSHWPATLAWLDEHGVR